MHQAVQDWFTCNSWRVTLCPRSLQRRWWRKPLMSSQLRSLLLYLLLWPQALSMPRRGWRREASFASAPPEDQCMWTIKPCLLWQGMCVSPSLSLPFLSSWSSGRGASHFSGAGNTGCVICLPFISGWMRNVGKARLLSFQILGFRRGRVGTE